MLRKSVVKRCGREKIRIKNAANRVVAFRKFNLKNECECENEEIQNEKRRSRSVSRSELYPGRDLNPYNQRSQDFKSCVSTNSTTRANKDDV